MSTNPTLEHLNNQLIPNTMLETLHIKFTNCTEDELTAEMPVSPKVHQPYGMLHGGASAALAETVGSTFSALHVDKDNFVVVGTNLECHHLRGVSQGLVSATASFIRKGRTMHLVKIEIKDHDGHLINHSVLTNTVIPKK